MDKLLSSPSIDFTHRPAPPWMTDGELKAILDHHYPAETRDAIDEEIQKLIDAIATEDDLKIFGTG